MYIQPIFWTGYIVGATIMILAILIEGVFELSMVERFLKERKLLDAYASWRTERRAKKLAALRL
jgi:hypothetical protein